MTGKNQRGSTSPFSRCYRLVVDFSWSANLMSLWIKSANKQLRTLLVVYYGMENIFVAWNESSGQTKPVTDRKSLSAWWPFVALYGLLPKWQRDVPGWLLSGAFFSVSARYWNLDFQIWNQWRIFWEMTERAIHAQNLILPQTWNYRWLWITT